VVEHSGNSEGGGEQSCGGRLNGRAWKGGWEELETKKKLPKTVCFELMPCSRSVVRNCFEYQVLMSAEL
jgi:hypothetical protein